MNLQSQFLYALQAFPCDPFLDPSLVVKAERWLRDPCPHVDFESSGLLKELAKHEFSSKDESRMESSFPLEAMVSTYTFEGFSAQELV